ncbi:polyphosphate polymerase domain-containing protein [bacterium AH-315-M05]|nr:polyphosphate polymerase domain-containing protein [bacterium AH-315-M05]
MKDIEQKEALIPLLSTFQPVSLEGMNKIKLLNRQDTKFIFNFKKLPSLLEQLKDKYYVLEVENHRITQYESQYFDTDDLRFYTQHHNGKLNRHKVRFRCYVESNTCYFEIKLKSNKGRTIKERIKKKKINMIKGKRAKQLLIKNIAIKPSDLIAKLLIYYSRITLAHKDFTERVTIDTGLKFKNDMVEKSLSELIIAEVKQDKVSLNSPFIQLMRKEKIQPMRLSKYCIGTILTNENIKYNRFKPKLLTINKIAYGNAA